MSIRVFDEQDIPVVAAIERACAAFPWSDGQFLSSIESGHFCRGLEASGGMVGFCIFSLVADEACLLNIAVNPPMQGKGYGRQLLQQGMAEVSGLGARSCYLEVRESNRTALALYRSLGFQRVGKRKAYYPAYDGREDALVMSRPLPVSAIDSV